MKKILASLLAGLLINQLAFAQTVYDGYAAYYRGMNGIFQHEASFKIKGGRNAIVPWQNQRLELKLAKAFPREFTFNDDLGNRAVGFEKLPYACVEGQSSSSSGTAVRHKSVYLFDARTTGHVKLYKLPSLFASCGAVRIDEQGRPLFHSANYIYSEGSDNPNGIILREYVISEDEFLPTGHSVSTRFVEPENVWKFEVVAVE